jgi:hypothetical protein
MKIPRSIWGQATPARRPGFGACAVAAATAVLVLTAGASSAMAQAPVGPVDPGIADGTAQQQLDAAKQRWQAANVSDYHYTVQRQCFCVPSFVGPVTIVVRDDLPQATPAGFEDVATVSRLHAIVQQAIDDRVERLGVVYGARGVPASIAIDRSSMIADDEITYRVSGFTVDPRSRLLVSYRRTGGFIGVDDRLSVARDGRAIRTERGGAPTEFDVSPADLSELKNALEAADFPSLKPVYKPPFPISDGFVFTITYRSKTVVAFEGGVPAALEPPIAVLSRLFASPPA